MERERLSSRLGFILLSAGCAIGIGNVWKFPYMVGQNGGGIFVLLYLFFLLVMGIPWAGPARKVPYESTKPWPPKAASGTSTATSPWQATTCL